MNASQFRKKPVEAMQWDGPEHWGAKDIVEWVNARGGEARYEPEYVPLPTGCDCGNCDDVGGHGPRVVIRGSARDLIVQTGDTVRATDNWFGFGDEALGFARIEFLVERKHWQHCEHGETQPHMLHPGALGGTLCPGPPAAPSVSTGHKGAIQRLLNAAHGKPFLTEDMIWSAQVEMNALIESARPDPYLVRDTIGRFRRDAVEHLQAEAKRHAASWPDDRRYQQGIEYAAARLRAGWPTEAQQ